MEAQFNLILKDWSENVGILPEPRPTLVISKHGLDSKALDRLRAELVKACGPDAFSCILSLKMMHIYFRQGDRTFDYRPHRGPFSGIVQSEYRIPNTDRAEALIRLNTEELKSLNQYIENIERSPVKVLGKPHPLQLREPDFTVRPYQTTARLDSNLLLDETVRHNCLTWLTTAPLGNHGEPLWKLLKMTEEDLKAEAHSYIVPFYHHLVTAAPLERVPAVVFWTEIPLIEALTILRLDPHFIERYYSNQTPSPEIPARISGT